MGAGRGSRRTRGPGVRGGARTCAPEARPAAPVRAPPPSSVRPATQGVVFPWPWGTGARAPPCGPSGARARLRRCRAGARGQGRAGLRTRRGAGGRRPGGSARPQGPAFVVRQAAAREDPVPHAGRAGDRRPPPRAWPRSPGGAGRAPPRPTPGAARPAPLGAPDGARREAAATERRGRREGGPRGAQTTPPPPPRPSAPPPADGTSRSRPPQQHDDAEQQQESAPYERASCTSAQRDSHHQPIGNPPDDSIPCAFALVLTGPSWYFAQEYPSDR